MIPARRWATPLTIGSFIVMAITGILMFFHVDRGINAGAHEWVAWLFLIGVAGHVTANFRPLKGHLKSSWGRTSVGVFAVVVVASFFTWGVRSGGQLLSAIRDSLVNTPLSTLATVVHAEPEALQRRLMTHGVLVRQDQTIRDLTGDDTSEQLHLLEVVFLP
jgi:amino acid transporter